MHLLADLEHVPLARLERPEPLVLELDEFLLAHRELLVAVREAAFHADEPLNRVGQGALPLRRELLALEERLDLGLGFLEVTGKVHVEPPDAVLVVLDRLLAVVQGPGPFLDAPFLGAGLLPLDADGAEVVVDRGAGRGDLLLLLLEVVPLALQALRLSFQVGRAGLQLGFSSVQLLLPRLERILRLLEPRRGGFHRFDEERGGLVTRHGHVTANRRRTVPPVSASLYKPSAEEIIPENISRPVAGLRVRPAGPGAVEIDGGRGDAPASARATRWRIVKRCQTDERHL